MSIALHHALEMVQTLFEAVEKMPAQALLEEEPIGPPIALARESLASAIALGVDDATLQTLALNIGGLIGALQWNADLIRGSSGTRPKDFLEKNEPLRRSLESMLKFLEDHWTAKLK